MAFTIISVGGGAVQRDPRNGCCIDAFRARFLLQANHSLDRWVRLTFRGLFHRMVPNQNQVGTQAHKFLHTTNKGRVGLVGRNPISSLIFIRVLCFAVGMAETTYGRKGRILLQPHR